MLLGTLVFRPYVVLTALITEEKEHTKLMIVLGKGNFWFRFCLFIQFLTLCSMDEKAEAEPKTALDK